jgi:hypothetical protein
MTSFHDTSSDGVALISIKPTALARPVTLRTRLPVTRKACTAPACWSPTIQIPVVDSKALFSMTTRFGHTPM